MEKEDINFFNIEKKWQNEWFGKGIFSVKEGKGKKYYVLVMFPYPSGSGLHMGHALNYTIGDICARYKRMSGYNVLHPMGFDSLGLPAENAAIQAKSHPKKFTENAVKNYVRQMKELGISYDWNRMVETHKPEYYKWDQWIFLKMFERGLAYKKQAPVNFCSKCNTVLANEQVHDGKCWRHKDTAVEVRQMNQWFLKITDYADELYEGIDKLTGWPELIKKLQKNWIGKSHGIEIEFEIETPGKENEISNVVLVHGCPDANEPRSVEQRTYEKHWRLWLKENLEKKGVHVDAPLMPEPWEPNYKKWKKEFDKIEINEDSILVGHSCGCAFLVRWLGETKQKIKKLILVAPWKIPYRKDKSDIDFYEYKINECVKSNVGEIIIFTSNDEEEDGKKSVKLYEKDIGGKIIELKNHGHYTFGDMGTHEFPELRDEIFSNKKYPIFTTRPDTIFGVTFMVVSAQHPDLMELVTEKQQKEVDRFLKKIKSTSEKDMKEMDKEGVFTGSYAINPLTNEKVPVYAGNFVVADYGSGMVMAVPAHDSRDFEFAKKYKIPIKEVIKGGSIKERAFTDEGILVNSKEFNGMKSNEAIQKISDYIEKNKLGKKTINYRLKDWLISRQRFWGTPIPVVYCEKCGIVAVPEKDLPVKLPDSIKFTSEKNPLINDKKFTDVKCPKCKGKAKRETDTMDTFVNSSWYFLRYCDSKNSKQIFDKKKAKYWMPVDQYIGGKEHACMHLIYFRFYTKFLRDSKLLDFDEPAVNLFNQGMLHDKNGEMMSKSAGNIVLPEEVSKKYGMDTARLFLVSASSPDSDKNWDEKGVEGSLRFINKIFEIKTHTGKMSEKLESKLNSAIKKVSEQIEKFQYNMAVIELRDLFESIEKEPNTKAYESFLKMLHPFCPHITEELWHKIGNKTFISLEKWPVSDEKKINKKLEDEEKLIEQTKNDVLNILKILNARNQKYGIIQIAAIPNEVKLYEENKDYYEKSFNAKVEIYDIKNFKGDKKAKPGKPAIYVE